MHEPGSRVEAKPLNPIARAAASKASGSWFVIAECQGETLPGASKPSPVAPLDAIANKERKLPPAYSRADGYGITPAARRYLGPLTRGKRRRPTGATGSRPTSH